MTEPQEPYPAAIDGVPFSVEPHTSLPSTNDRARELAATGATDVVVVADRQTMGRGRLDREWASPPGGIWLSLLVWPDLPIDRLPLLTFAAAIATVEAVRGVGGEAVIKWPNDVLVEVDGEERKLAGILTESATTDGAVEWAIIGIGLNANVDPDELPVGSISLRALVGDVDRVAVTERLLVSFDRLRADPDAILEAWRRYATTIDRQVRVTTDDGTIEGRAVDIDTAGRLLVDVNGTIERVAAGDCQHLRPA